MHNVNPKHLTVGVQDLIHLTRKRIENIQNQTFKIEAICQNTDLKTLRKTKENIIKLRDEHKTEIKNEPDINDNTIETKLFENKTKKFKLNLTKGSNKWKSEIPSIISHSKNNSSEKVNYNQLNAKNSASLNSSLLYPKQQTINHEPLSRTRLSNFVSLSGNKSPGYFKNFYISSRSKIKNHILNPSVPNIYPNFSTINTNQNRSKNNTEEKYVKRKSHYSISDNSTKDASTKFNSKTPNKYDIKSIINKCDEISVFSNGFSKIMNNSKQKYKIPQEEKSQTYDCDDETLNIDKQYVNSKHNEKVDQITKDSDIMKKLNEETAYSAKDIMSEHFKIFKYAQSNIKKDSIIKLRNNTGVAKSLLGDMEKKKENLIKNMKLTTGFKK